MKKSVRMREMYTTKQMEYRDEKGAITVFLLLIFLGVFAFTALLVEGARIRSARATLSHATNTSIRSTLAGFDAELKETYGLFSCNEDELSKVPLYLDKNLAFGNGGSSWDPYAFEVVNAQVSGQFPLSDLDIFERQILEYIKYRGLVSCSMEFVEKVQGFFRMSETACSLSKEQEVDEEIMDLSDAVLRLKQNINGHVSFASSTLGSIEHKIASYFKDLESIEDKEEAIERLKERRSEAESPDTRAHYSERIGEKRDDIDDLEKSSKKAKKKAIEAIELEIDKLDESIEIVLGLIKEAGNIDDLISENETFLESQKYSNEEEKNRILDKLDHYETMVDENQLKQLIKDFETNTAILQDLKQLFSRSSLSNGKIESTSKGYLSSFKVDVRINTQAYDKALSESNESPDDQKLSLDLIKKTMAFIKNIFAPNPISETVYNGEKQTLPSVEHGFDRESEDESTPSEKEETSSSYSDRMRSKYGFVPKSNSETMEDEKEYLKNTLAKADKGLSNNKDVESFFENGLTGDMRDDVLVNEYAILMFNSRTTKVNENAFFQKCEVEYLIFGEMSETTNAFKTQLSIFGLRLVPNYLAVRKDIKTQALVDSAAVSLAALTGGVGYPAYRELLFGVIAMVEAGVDTYQLQDGFTIPLLKTSSDTIIGSNGKAAMDILIARTTDSPMTVNDYDVIKGSSGSGSSGNGNTPKKTGGVDLRKDYEVPGLAEKDEPKTHSVSVQVDYEDHLRFLLLVQDLAGGRNKKLRRMQDLIQINFEQRRPHFKINNYVTYISAEITASIKSIFFGNFYFEANDFPENAEYFKDRRIIQDRSMLGY